MRSNCTHSNILTDSLCTVAVLIVVPRVLALNHVIQIRRDHVINMAIGIHLVR